jgi:uridine kinase
MAEYTLKYINHRAECDAEAFVNDCEEHYHRQLHLVADQIAANCKRKPVVLLNGPSSSGKTTTNDRLGRILELAGIHAHMISMDDYYRTSGTYDIPFDKENGVNDLESPECMDLDLLRDHLTRLVAGEEIMVPRFDFETRTSHRNDRPVQLHKDEIVMIEGIHAFNPVIMGDLEKHATSVYLSVASVLLTDHNIRVEPHMLRFLRRAMRDSLFRSSPVEYTLKQWNSVRRGERLYISPYRGQADLTVDTYLPYETNILMQYLSEKLQVEEKMLEQADLAPLSAILDKVSPIDYKPYMPEDSVLHEFIG